MFEKIRAQLEKAGMQVVSPAQIPDHVHLEPRVDPSSFQFKIAVGRNGVINPETLTILETTPFPQDGWVRLTHQGFGAITSYRHQIFDVKKVEPVVMSPRSLPADAVLGKDRSTPPNLATAINNASSRGIGRGDLIVQIYNPEVFR